MKDSRAKYSDNTKIPEAARLEYARDKYDQMEPEAQHWLDVYCKVLMDNRKGMSKGGALCVLLALGSFLNERER